MGTVNAKRRTSAAVRGGRRPGGPGGNRRGALEQDELMEKIEAAITFNTPRVSVAKQLGIPISTLYAYASKIEARWKAESVHTRDEARQAAVRRVERIVRSAFVQKKYRDAVAGEQLRAKLEGTEQPGRLELGGVPPGPNGAGGAPIAISSMSDAMAALARLQPPKPAGT